MFYIAFGSLCLLIVFIIINYAYARDIMYPPVLHSLIWFGILFLFKLNSTAFIGVSASIYILVVVGVYTFSFGSFFGTLGMSTASWSFSIEKPCDTWFTHILFVTPLLGFPLFVYKAYVMAVNGPFPNMFMNLRFSLISPEKAGYGILAYLVTLSFVSVGIELYKFCADGTRWRVAVSVSAALLYALLSTGRTFFMILFAIIFGILLVTRKLSRKWAILFFAGINFSIFFMLGLLQLKGGNLDQSFTENVIGMRDQFRTYLLAPLAALDQFMSTNKTFTNGETVFRFFLAVMSKLGWSVPVSPLIQEYQYVPMPVNVYTVYQPYFKDFSYYGVVLIQFFLGFFHGFLYKKTKEGQAVYIILFSLFLYPLFMQFFQDQYFNLLSTWVQYFLILTIYVLDQKRHTRMLKKREQQLIRENRLIMGGQT